MASSTKIDEIIDPKAFADWERFVKSLETGQQNMSKMVSEVMDLNKAIQGSASLKDMQANVKSLQEAYDKLDKERSKLVATQDKLAKAEEALVKLTAEKARVLKEESQATKEVSDSSEKYTGTLSTAVVKVAELKKEMADLNASYKANKDSMPIEEAAKYEQQMSLLKAELGEANKEVRNQAKETNASAGAFQASLTPYQQFSKQVKAAKDTAKDLGAELINLKNSGKGSDAEIESLSKEFNDASKSALALDKEIKDLDESVGDSQRDVGNYNVIWDNLPGPIKNVITVFEGLGEAQKALVSQGAKVLGFQTATQKAEQARVVTSNALASSLTAQATATTVQANASRQMIGFTVADTAATEANAIVTAENAVASEAAAVSEAARATATTGATAATNASTGSLGKLKIALISTGIGAIVVVIGLLIAAFLSTQRGADALTRRLEPLKAIFQGIIGVVQNLATDIVDAFKNPQQALKDLGKAILDNIVNRFTAVGVILDGIANRDFSKITNGLVQMTTGVENVNGKLKKGVDFLKSQAAIGKQIAEKSIQLEKAQNNLINIKDKYEDKERALLLISKDTSKSFKERAAAANEIIKITQDYAKEAAKVKQIEIDRLKLQQSLKDTKRQGKGSQEELKKLQMELDDINDSGEVKQIEQSKVLSGLKKEQNQITEEGADLEAKRLAEIQELNRTEIQQIQFVLAEKLKALKIDKDESKLTKDELGAKVALEKEANDKIAELGDSLQSKKRDLATKRAEFERDTLEDVAQINLEASQDEALEYVDRLASLKDYSDAKQLVIDSDNKLELAKLDEQRIEAKKLLLDGKTEEYQALKDIIKIEEDKIAKLKLDKERELAEKVKKTAFEITKQEYKDKEEWALIALEQTYQKENELLVEQKANGLITEEEFLQKRSELLKKFNDESLQLQIDQLKKLIDASKAAGQDTGALEKQLAKLQIQQAKAVTDAKIEGIDKVLEKEQEAKDKIKEYAKETAKLIIDIANQAMDAKIAETEAKIADNEVEKQIALERIENSTLNEEQKAAQKFAIESKFAAKEKQLEEQRIKMQQRQAKINKAIAIGEIVISTAKGVARALFDYPFPLSLGVAAAVGAFGLVQGVLVARQQVPQFYKGTDSSPEGWAHIGERGTELMVKPDGTAQLTPPTDTLAYLDKGTKIYNARETKSILSGQKGIDSMKIINFDKLIVEQKRSTSELKKSFRDNASQTMITKEGLRVVHARNSKLKNYLSKNNL